MTDRILFPQTLFLTCSKGLPLLPDHPVFKPGVTVKIGLGKTSALKALFQRYVEVCNELNPSFGETIVQYGELEFVHYTVLHESDNAEAAALMKNDRITVRPDSMDERRTQESRHSIQRESDRRYFMVLRKDLLLEQPGDTFLRCTDDVVECHSFLVRKRCPWLGRLIDEAFSRESGRQSIITVPGSQEVVKAVDPGVAHIEIDEDEPALPIAEKIPSKVWVSVDYPEAAVKLLLEYCYTNRVYSLGLDAFLRSCKTTTPVHLSPVPPFSVRRWPSRGEPTVTLPTALCTIALAAEAEMPRLILQCEIAASHLVDVDTAVAALEATRQLPILRRAATEILLHAAEDLETLDVPPRVIPILLSGVSECVANRVSSGGRKRPRIDQSLKDANDRERERQSHRLYV